MITYYPDRKLPRPAFLVAFALCANLSQLSLTPEAQAANKQQLPYDTAGVSFGALSDSLPEIRFVHGDPDFLQALNGDLYPTAEDLKPERRWIRRQARELETFWEYYGDSVLHSLATYSGLAWSKEDISIHLVRYLSSWELPNPPTLALGGRRLAGIIEAGPNGAERILQLIHLLSHQLLSRSSRALYPQLNNGLMKRSPFHREVLVQLLTLSVSADIIKQDDFLKTINSPTFARRHPGYDLLFTELWGIWTLSANSPLTKYLGAETFDGTLRFRADSTLAAHNFRKESALALAQRILPPGGQMGMALERVSAGLRVIDSDPDRLAFAYGIVEGDIIRSINGVPAKQLREFYAELLSTYEAGGAELRIRRNDEEYTIVIKLAPPGYPELE